MIVLAIAFIAGMYITYRQNNPQNTADPYTASNASTTTPTVEDTPDPIPSDWLSYTSEKYNFMIRYPSDFEHDTTSEGERFFKLGETQTTGTELFDGISVIINSGKTNNEDFRMFVEKQYDSMKNDPTQAGMGEIESITVAGKEGYAYTVKSLGKRFVIYLPRGRDQYIRIINGTVEPSNRPQTYQRTVDMMLSSLIYE